jgi:hypothetical protein
MLADAIEHAETPERVRNRFAELRAAHN